MKLNPFSRVACDAFVLALVAIPLCAAEPAPSSDDQLMKSLDSELLDGLDTLPAADDSVTPGHEEPSPDIATGDTDEFTRISQRMRKLERMIPHLEKKQPTTQLQKEVVTELEKLIADLEKQCQQSQSSASSGNRQSQQTAERESVKQPSQQAAAEGEQNPNRPARDSTERLGKDEARKADLAERKGLLKDVWGQLPEKAREQLLQSSPEQFLPKYELLIEDYYRKLAEKQPQ